MTDTYLRRLFERLRPYRNFLYLGIILFLGSIASSLVIYYKLPADHPQFTFWEKLADFLMNIGQTMLGTLLIGGGIGGIFNFITEEMKKEEEAAKEEQQQRQEKAKELRQDRQEQREKNRLFLWEMQQKLQQVYDSTELARILIRSHKSGKSYGDQVRQHIMPSLISLEDFKRRLSRVEDRKLVRNLECLEVSINYMAAYLSVLIQEFERNYIKISNLQRYQEAVATRMRSLFTEVAEDKANNDDKAGQKERFLTNPDAHFEAVEVPEKIEVVWQAMEELEYIWDFIAEFRNEQGQRSRYYQHFMLHYFHCLKILQHKDGNVNKRLTEQPAFVTHVEELRRIAKKKKSDQPLTKHDNLTRKIMADELGFQFEQ